jgi:HK97 family phage portal protein
VLNNLFTAPERRAITFQKLFEIGREVPSGTRAGVIISDSNSLTIGPVYAAIRLISDSISTLPLDTFFRQDGERLPFRPRPMWVDQPEPDPSIHRTDHYQMMLVSLLIDGNSFSRIIRNDRGDIVALSILDPRRVRVARNSDGRIEFIIDEGRRRLSEDDVVHITELRQPGALRGTSRIKELRETLGLTKALEEFASAFFGSGSTTSGVIEVPQELTAEQAKSLQDSWEQGHKGFRKAHRPGILSAGAKYTQTSVDPQDAQALQSREFAVEEVARIFRIPVHMLQSTRAGAMSYASVEESSRQFVTYTLLPYIAKIESAYSRLLPGEAFIRFNVDGLLRANLQDRYAAYSVGMQAGFLSINDIHRLEDLRPVPNGGDEYRVPLANVNLGAANVVELEKRVTMATKLVQVGYEPAAAAAAVGLDPIAHTGLPTVQLQNATQAAESEADSSDAYPVRALDAGDIGEAISDAIRSMPAPVVNVALPEQSKQRKIERDEDGNITRIVEE